MDEKINSLLQALVRIDSVNPSLVPGGAGEAAIAHFISGWLRTRGIEAELDEAAPGRFSVIGRIKGRGRGKSLVLNAHVDTVGVAGMSDPHGGRIVESKLYGRGAFDMKGGLAACMMAMSDLRDAGLAGDLILAAVADEEHASLGVQSVLRRISADAAIVTEPTDLQVVVAHKGFTWHDITTHGRAAHGSRPDLGVDAIALMGRVLNRVEHLQSELSRRPPHPLLGHGSVHASLIQGGQELSSYPEKCILQVERRTLPGEQIGGVEADFSAIVTALAGEDARFRAECRTTLVRPPFSVSPEAEIVRLIQQQATQLFGKSPAVCGATPWMDAAFFAEAGIATVVFGPGGAGAHAVEEWGDLESVSKCRDVLVGTAKSFCQ